MKFKLDENVDLRILSQFRLSGYDVATVQEQNLTSAPDTELIEICHQEGRCLVTADRDFSNGSGSLAGSVAVLGAAWSQPIATLAIAVAIIQQTILVLRLFVYPRKCN